MLRLTVFVSDQNTYLEMRNSRVYVARSVGAGGKARTSDWPSSEGRGKKSRGVLGPRRSGLGMEVYEKGKRVRLVNVAKCLSTNGPL